MALPEKEVNSFVKEVDRHLLCPKSTKQKFLSDLKNDVAEFAEHNGVNDLRSCVHRLQLVR